LFYLSGEKVRVVCRKLHVLVERFGSIRAEEERKWMCKIELHRTR
jgi:hypothetical protein